MAGWNDKTASDREELNAENRAMVMAWWRRFEHSRTGIWLSRHTGLLRSLSDEESRLVQRTGLLAIVLALILLMMAFLACHGDMLPFTLLALPILVAAFMVVLALWIFWDAYRDSDERAADRLANRPGLATWRQIAADYGPRAVNRDIVPSVLPRMLSEFRNHEPGAIRPRPWHAAWYVGRSWDMEVWLGSERHIYVLGPTRSGKTVSVVVPAVVEAPGFVLATSTRGDIVKTTRWLRECGVKDRKRGAEYGGHGPGTTHIFDPEGVASNDPETRHNMNWTPLQGCDDPSVAMRRAQTMVANTGMGSGSNNAEWGVSAAMYVQAMLYAATIADRTINDCYKWSLSPESAQEAADLIRQYTDQKDMDRWAATLNALPHVDPKQKGSEWFGVKGAFSILADPNVRARMNLSPSDPRLIDPRSMVLRGDTVYVLSRPRREGESTANSGVFVSLLLDTFQEACQDLAFDRGSGSRGKIEPPARFVLDELSNIEKWPGLRNAITQGGGNGYQMILVEQSRQQMSDEDNGYGKAVEQTVWENCHKIMLKGTSDKETLEWWIALIGSHDHTRRESSWNPGQGPLGGLTTRHEREEAVTQRELNLLPVGYGLVAPLGQAPALTRMVMYMDRDWWRDDLRNLRPRTDGEWHEMYCERM